MDPTASCPECTAPWPQGLTCQDHFHQMLFWENEHPPNGEVHHLMVLCYHLQHPSLYSPDGLREGKRLLVDFLEGGLTTEEVRRRNRDRVDSGKRQWKVTSRSGAQGSYERPVQWTMTAGDVVAAGMENYRESVRQWARTVLESIRRAERGE